MDAGEIKAISEGEGLRKDLGAANDEEFFFTGGAGKLDACVQRGDDLRVGRMKIRVAREHDQFAARHLSFGTLVGLAAHEHVVAHGEAAEILEVVGEVPRKAAIAADAIAFVEGGDERNDHEVILVGKT